MFAERLRLLREKSKLKQSDIANILNISTPAYGFYEQKKREPTFETLIKIANFYHVSTDYLLGISDSSHEKIEQELILETTISANNDKISSDFNENETELIQYYRNLDRTDQLWLVGQAIDLDRKSKSRESESPNIESEPKHA